jgi:N-acetylneuraminic acid mutarotase
MPSLAPFVFRVMIVLACLIFGSGQLFTELSAAESPYRWELITAKAEFAPRDGAGALSYRGRMWLLGGWNPIPAQRAFFPMICNNEVWSTEDGRSWSLDKANTFFDKNFDRDSDWEGRHTAGYVVYKDRMWIVGGDCNQKHYQNDVWNSQDGKQWTQLNPGSDVPWKDRVLHYTVVQNDQIWVIGGQSMPAFVESPEIFYRDIWTTTDGINWKELTPQEPCWSPRGMIGGAAVMNGRVWILGGGTYDTPTKPRNFYNDVWSSADGIHWTQHTAAAPWHPRQYHDVAVWDNQLWVMEGYHATGGNRNDVWYSPDGSTWKELPDTPWKPRHAASVFIHNDALWMVAGNNMESDVWKLVRR